MTYLKGYLNKRRTQKQQNSFSNKLQSGGFGKDSGYLGRRKKWSQKQKNSVNPGLKGGGFQDYGQWGKLDRKR